MLISISCPSNIVTQLLMRRQCRDDHRIQRQETEDCCHALLSRRPRLLIGDVTVGDEASIWWGAVLRSDQNANPIVVGARTSIQDNCVIHSGEAPTIIEDDCTIGHGAIMEGPLIRRGAIIGMNCHPSGKRRDRRRSAHRRRQRRRASHQDPAAQCSPPARPRKSRKSSPAKHCTGSRWDRRPT